MHFFDGRLGNGVMFPESDRVAQSTNTKRSNLNVVTGTVSARLAIHSGTALNGAPRSCFTLSCEL
jgi:hypothetical protein